MRKDYHHAAGLLGKFVSPGNPAPERLKRESRTPARPGPCATRMELQVPDASNKSFSTFDLFFRSSCPFSDDTALGHVIGVVAASMRGDDMLELTKRFAKCDAGAISLEHGLIAAGIAAAFIIAVGSHGAQVRPAFAKMRLQLAIQASALSSGRSFRRFCQASASESRR
jgi:Flp pilus assembly pilin Flp